MISMKHNMDLDSLTIFICHNRFEFGFMTNGQSTIFNLFPPHVGFLECRRCKNEEVK